MFKTALREGIERAQEGLRRARGEGLPDEESAHAARLLDLVDRAESNGPSRSAWRIPPSERKERITRAKVSCLRSSTTSAARKRARSLI